MRHFYDLRSLGGVNHFQSPIFNLSSRPPRNILDRYHSRSDISEKVDTARLHRKDLHRKDLHRKDQAYLDLLELFSIADDFCEVHDNDNVNCDISKLTQN